MADGPAFFYFFPDRCIHPCPSEHSRIPLPTDLLFFISFQAGASIRVSVSIPECYRRQTCIFLFFSGQMHPSISLLSFPNPIADSPPFFLFLSRQVYLSVS